MSFVLLIMKYGVFNLFFSMFVFIFCNVFIYVCDGKYFDNKNGKIVIIFWL